MVSAVNLIGLFTNAVQLVAGLSSLVKSVQGVLTSEEADIIQTQLLSLQEANDQLFEALQEKLRAGVQK